MAIFGIIGLVVLAGMIATCAVIAGRMADKCDEINRGNPDDEGAAWEAAQHHGGAK